MGGSCVIFINMIAILIPTRGMVFSEVLDAVERERQGKDVRVYTSHDLPIPDGHNELVKQALLDGADKICFIEEDTVPPPGSLEVLLEQSSDISCIDYGVSGWGCVTKNESGEILWCGLGCTMIDIKVFKAMEYPYFRADKTLRLNDWKWIDLPQEYIQKKNYGSLDIWFFTKARQLGFKIGQVQGECDHLELEFLGKKEINNGLHKIRRRPRIIYNQILNNNLERG